MKKHILTSLRLTIVCLFFSSVESIPYSDAELEKLLRGGEKGKLYFSKWQSSRI